MEMLLLPEQTNIVIWLIVFFNNSLKYYMNEHPAVTHDNSTRKRLYYVYAAF